jgi:hypothetical protein
MERRKRYSSLLNLDDGFFNPVVTRLPKLSYRAEPGANIMLKKVKEPGLITDLYELAMAAAYCTRHSQQVHLAK